MKQVLSILLLCLVALSSCKETDSAVNEANNERLRAALKENYPSLRNGQIRIEVKEFRDVNILLGDKQLFAVSDDSLKKVTDFVGEMVCDMYEENNYLGKGTITFVEVERRVPTNEDTKRVFDMNIEKKLKTKNE